MDIEKIEVGSIVYVDHWGKKFWCKVKSIKQEFDSYMIRCEGNKTLKELFGKKKETYILDATPRQISECLTEDEAKRRVVLDAL